MDIFSSSSETAFADLPIQPKIETFSSITDPVMKALTWLSAMVPYDSFAPVDKNKLQTVCGLTNELVNALLDVLVDKKALTRYPNKYPYTYQRTPFLNKISVTVVRAAIEGGFTRNDEIQESKAVKTPTVSECIQNAHERIEAIHEELFAVEDTTAVVMPEESNNTSVFADTLVTKIPGLAIKWHSPAEERSLAEAALAELGNRPVVMSSQKFDQDYPHVNQALLNAVCGRGPIQFGYIYNDRVSWSAGSIQDIATQFGCEVHELIVVKRIGRIKNLKSTVHVPAA